jgi:hypothetical protein
MTLDGPETTGRARTDNLDLGAVHSGTNLTFFLSDGARFARLRKN